MTETTRMPRLLLALLAAGLASCVSLGEAVDPFRPLERTPLGPPPARGVPRGSSWAIVLASTSSANEAKRALAEASDGLAQWVKPVEGYPRVVESTTVPGFKPGYHVVVLGYCEKKTDASVAHGYARLATPAAYLKKVDAKFEDACPQLPGSEKSKLGAPTERLATAQVPGGGGLRLEVLAGNERSQAECRIRDLAVQLRRGAELLDEHAWQAECTGACTKEEKQEGERVRKETQEAIARGEASETEFEDVSTHCTALSPSLSEDLSRFGRPLFTIGITREGPHGDRYFDYQAIGLGCRDTLAVSKVLETSSLIRYSWPKPFTEKEARQQDPKARWRSLQWYLEGANANPLSEKRGVKLETKWDQEGCHLTLRGEEAP